MPLISVVIPAYNSEKTIVETVQSVLAQTFDDFEIVVINDGSKDSTLEKLNGLCDSRLTVLSYDNSGVAVSRNRGISAAKGEFIAFLDADDLWAPEKLASQYRALKNTSDAALAYSWVNCIGDDGTFLRAGMRPTFEGDVYQPMLTSNFLECGSNPLVKRSALDHVGGFDQELPPSEDWEMWLRLAKKYRFVLVPIPQIFYRVSTNSASFNLEKHETSKLKAFEKVFEEAPPEFHHLKRLCLSNFYRYLTFKTLDTSINVISNRRRGFLAARYLWLSLSHHPKVMREPKVFFSTLFRILSLLMMPKSQQLSQTAL